MRWLLLVLLISVAGLLFAALGLARHVLRQRAQKGSKPSPDAAAPSVPAEKNHVDTEL
jgi:hypothetical protein